MEECVRYVEQIKAKCTSITSFHASPVELMTLITCEYYARAAIYARVRSMMAFF
jgi:hypothetical protein